MLSALVYDRRSCLWKPRSW